MVCVCVVDVMDVVFSVSIIIIKYLYSAKFTNKCALMHITSSE